MFTGATNLSLQMGGEERQHAGLRQGPCSGVVCIVTDEPVAGALVGMQCRSRPFSNQDSLDGERVGKLRSRQHVGLAVMQLRYRNTACPPDAIKHWREEADQRF